MKKSVPLFSAACLLLSMAWPAPAQETASGGPPKILHIIREVVKPGKAAAHEKVEAGWPRAFAKANWPTHYLAATTVTGPNEAWFLEGYDSFDAWEKGRNDIEKDPLKTEDAQLSQQDGELLSTINRVAARYREDLSYRPNVNIGQMRYFAITMVRVRPGHDNDFAESRKLTNVAREKANVDDHSAVYQVISGAPSGTFLIFSPMKSLARMDELPKIYTTQAYRDAVGDEGRKKLQELANSGTLFAETTVLAFSPKMSYVAKEIAAADPDFWTPKPKAAKAAPPAKKATEKPAAE